MERTPAIGGLWRDQAHCESVIDFGPIGDTVEIAARWDLAYNLSFQAGWQIFIKGEFPKSAPGAPLDHGDVNYFYLESQFRL